MARCSTAAGCDAATRRARRYGYAGRPRGASSRKGAGGIVADVGRLDRAPGFADHRLRRAGAVRDAVRTRWRRRGRRNRAWTCARRTRLRGGPVRRRAGARPCAPRSRAAPGPEGGRHLRASSGDHGPPAWPANAGAVRTARLGDRHCSGHHPDTAAAFTASRRTVITTLTKQALPMIRLPHPRHHA